MVLLTMSFFLVVKQILTALGEITGFDLRLF